jgi:hypothetical protein
VTRLEIRGQKLEFLYIIGDVNTDQNKNNCGDDCVVGKRCIVLRKRERKERKKERKDE